MYQKQLFRLADKFYADEVDHLMTEDCPVCSEPEQPGNHSNLWPNLTLSFAVGSPVCIKQGTHNQKNYLTGLSSSERPFKQNRFRLG
jgi:hypothetical protein